MKYSFLIIGGMMSWPQRYEEMRATLAELTDGDVPVASLHPTDWARLFRIEGWGRLLSKAESAILSQTEASGLRTVIIGHSLGGVVGKLLAEYDSLHNLSLNAAERIGAVVGLGTPFRSERVMGTLKLRSLVESGSPNGRRVPCLGVAGDSVKGDAKGSLRERYAFQAYKWHIGRGDVNGDLMIPEPAVIVDGVKGVRLEGAYHEKFVNASWYGAPSVVNQWWPHLVEFLDQTE